MDPSPTLTIVLPAFNEAGRIEPALDELFGYLRRRGASARDGAPGAAELPGRIDVLVVDDGSTDGTADVVRARVETRDAQAGATLSVLSVPHGGKGAAVQAGMLHARTDLIVFADADMATPPDMLVPLVEALADADVALGSRIQPDGSDMRKSQPRYRRLLGKAFHLLASLWVVGPVQDTQCGFKGFRRGAAHDLFSRQQITSKLYAAARFSQIFAPGGYPIPGAGNLDDYFFDINPGSTFTGGLGEDRRALGSALQNLPWNDVAARADGLSSFNPSAA